MAEMTKRHPSRAANSEGVGNLTNRILVSWFWETLIGNFEV